MLSLDFFFFFLLIAQPSTLAAVFFVISRFRLSSVMGWTTRVLGVRLRLRGVRFFECAAYPRLHGLVRYQTQALALCGLFLIYDLDLVFFFPELTRLGNWSLWNFFLFLLWVWFFCAGVYYDSLRYGLGWDC